MRDPLVLSPRECQGLSWRPPFDVGFAAHRSLIPLHGGELAKAASAMPLALTKMDREWQLVGVCGVAPGHNLFIKNGVWLGHYRPDWFNTYPFGIWTSPASWMQPLMHVARLQVRRALLLVLTR